MLGLHLVMRGRALPVRPLDELVRVGEAYESKYGWRVAVRDGPSTTPKARRPQAHRRTGSIAFGFPAGAELPPTTGRFAGGRP